MLFLPAPVPYFRDSGIKWEREKWHMMLSLCASALQKAEKVWSNVPVSHDVFNSQHPKKRHGSKLPRVSCYSEA